MAYIRAFWENAKKTLKFIWRHLFTLGILSILISVFIEGPVNWKNGFVMVITAIFLDWAKQFIKVSSYPYDGRIQFYDGRDPLHIRQQWDSSLIGNCAYEVDHYPRIKYD